MALSQSEGCIAFYSETTARVVHTVSCQMCTRATHNGCVGRGSASWSGCRNPLLALAMQAVRMECKSCPKVELKIFCVARLAGLLYTLLLGA